MGYIGNQSSEAYSSVDKQVITGNGGTAYTLSHPVANANEIEVFVNNVRQEPGVAYNASNSTLTFTEALVNTDELYVVYQGKAVQTATHPTDAPLTASQINADNIRLDGNTISSTDTNGDITLDPNGTGDVVVASGNVMIGTTTEGFADYADTLTVADTDHAGITIRSGASSSGNLYFSDATSGSGEYDGYLNYNQSTQELAVGTAAATRVLIDSDGHVGIGDTTPISVLEVRKNSVGNGRLATFGSNGTASTDVVSGLANAITIGRSYINVPANTATNLVSGYGGSLVLLTILNASGVADVQRTVLVTHAWNSASVLFTNNYGGNNPTLTFSALSSNLRVSHNHSGALNFNVQALIIPGPATGG